MNTGEVKTCKCGRLGVQVLEGECSVEGKVVCECGQVVYEGKGSVAIISRGGGGGGVDIIAEGELRDKIDLGGGAWKEGETKEIKGGQGGVGAWQPVEICPTCKRSI